MLQVPNTGTCRTNQLYSFVIEILTQKVIIFHKQELRMSHFQEKNISDGEFGIQYRQSYEIKTHRLKNLLLIVFKYRPKNILNIKVLIV